MDRPRPLPSVERELSALTKRSSSSSVVMLRAYWEMFLSVTVILSGVASMSR